MESPVAEVGWICTRLPRATKGKGESEDGEIRERQ